jgi:hypothetical protein
MARVPRSEETRKRIRELFDSEFDKSALMREALRLMIEEALEAEVKRWGAAIMSMAKVPATATAIERASSKAPKASLNTPRRR